MIGRIRSVSEVDCSADKLGVRPVQSTTGVQKGRLSESIGVRGRNLVVGPESEVIVQIGAADWSALLLWDLGVDIIKADNAVIEHEFSIAQDRVHRREIIHIGLKSTKRNGISDIVGPEVISDASADKAEVE